MTQNISYHFPRIPNPFRMISDKLSANSSFKAKNVALAAIPAGLFAAALAYSKIGISKNMEQYSAQTDVTQTQDSNNSGSSVWRTLLAIPCTALVSACVVAILHRISSNRTDPSRQSGESLCSHLAGSGKPIKASRADLSTSAVTSLGTGLPTDTPTSRLTAPMPFSWFARSSALGATGAYISELFTKTTVPPETSDTPMLATSSHGEDPSGVSTHSLTTGTAGANFYSDSMGFQQKYSQIRDLAAILLKNDFASLTLSDKTDQKIRDLETSLRKKYFPEDSFSMTCMTMWHGALSLQRIVWQDSEFLKALCDPEIVKGILKKKSNGQEQKFLDKFTLSGFLLYGLLANRLDYLFSAAPNWNARPPVDQELLKKMGELAGTSSERPPRNLSEENFGLFARAIQTCLEQFKLLVPGFKPKSDSIGARIRDYEMLSVSALTGMITNILEVKNFHEIKGLVQGMAGASTGIQSMNLQALGALVAYPELRQAHGDAVALGFPAISHGLDMRHLLAGLTAFAKGSHFNFEAYTEEQREAQIMLANMLMDTSTSLSFEAQCLLKCRLLQVMELLVEKFNL